MIHVEEKFGGKSVIVTDAQGQEQTAWGLERLDWPNTPRDGEMVRIAADTLVNLAQPTYDGARTVVATQNPDWAVHIRAKESVAEIMAVFKAAGLEHNLPQIVPQGRVSKLLNRTRLAWDRLTG